MSDKFIGTPIKATTHVNQNEDLMRAFNGQPGA